MPSAKNVPGSFLTLGGDAAQHLLSLGERLRAAGLLGKRSAEQVSASRSFGASAIMRRYNASAWANLPKKQVHVAERFEIAHVVRIALDKTLQHVHFQVFWNTSP
jgi:hypothetical protein